jgi:GNAT superfamily N-acetyltransferase
MDRNAMVCKSLTESEAVEAIFALIKACPEIPYFTEKKPEVLSENWIKFMRAGIARSFAAYVDGKPVGLMLGLIMPDILGGVPQALECAWQVIPEYRSLGAGVELMKMFEESAREAKCVRVIFGASVEFEFEKMKRLYRRLGYKPVSLTIGKTL